MSDKNHAVLLIAVQREPRAHEESTTLLADTATALATMASNGDESKDAMQIRYVTWPWRTFDEPPSYEEMLTALTEEVR